VLHLKRENKVISVERLAYSNLVLHIEYRVLIEKMNIE